MSNAHVLNTHVSNSQVFKTPETEEYYFDEGCYILEMLNSQVDPEVSIARVKVEAGKMTRFHCLEGVTERYVIQQGKGRVTLGDSFEEDVQEGSVVVIPAGVRQRILNTGTSSLIFLAVCSPRFTLACYQDLEGD